PRPPVQTFRGGVVPFTVPLDCAAALRDCARRAETTLFTTLLAAFQVVLSVHSGHTEVVVGVPFAGRTRPGLDACVGPFSDTLPLRTDLSGNPSFVDVLGRVRSVLLDVAGDQEVPFGRIVEGLRLPRDAGRNPGFQALFNMGNLPLGGDRREL